MSISRSLASAIQVDIWGFHLTRCGLWYPREWVSKMMILALLTIDDLKSQIWEQSREHPGASARKGLGPWVRDTRFLGHASVSRVWRRHPRLTNISNQRLVSYPWSQVKRRSTWHTTATTSRTPEWVAKILPSNSNARNGIDSCKIYQEPQNITLQR